ncbi:MAG: hypothetical protein AAB474_02975 [Patescibacteria group bacterium]|mgnify:FL=1
MKRIVIFLVFLLSVNFCFGCSVSRALNQPEKRNFDVLKKGTHRDYVMAELGTPVSTGVEDDKTYDIFSLTQGYSKGNKVSRAFAHGVLDVASLGLWEVLANPIEGMASGKRIKIKILYKDNLIEEVKSL